MTKKVRPSAIDYLHPISIVGFILYVLIHPDLWLKSDKYRKVLCISRKYSPFRKRLQVVEENKNMVTGTLKKNSSKKFFFDGASRSQKLIFPLLSIESLLKRQNKLNVLSVGPRNEAELLTLFSYGFSPTRITALDIFSESPWITVGDMHNAPFNDNQFDIVFIGWVLAYSKTIPKAVSEIIRIAKPNAYVSIGWDAFDLSKTKPNASVDTVPIEGSDDILSYFSGHVASVIFKGEIDKVNNEVREQIVCVFRLK